MIPSAATIDILERLVAFPTISADSNLALIDYVEDLLQGAGFETHRMPDPEGRKSGLVARIGGAGDGGVLLSAHSDVVPVDGQAWTHPPFVLTREDDKLFGRGTTDMKGFLASMLALAQRVADTPLRKPLMLSISYDEEVGCQGIRKMMPAFQKLGWTPELCIVGEPTLMIPATGHKGKAALRATCRGTAGHSALAPRYVNALYLANDLMTALRDIQQAYATSDVKDASYDIPYSTVHVGRLHGGRALNIVPETAILEFELRHMLGDALEVFQERLTQVCTDISRAYQPISADVGIDIEVTNTYLGLEIATDAEAVQLTAAFCGANDLTKVSFGTEAGFFAGLGIATVVCGPGSMEGQGHKADEYISIDQLAQCDVMMGQIHTYLR